MWALPIEFIERSRWHLWKMREFMGFVLLVLLIEQLVKKGYSVIFAGLRGRFPVKPHISNT